MDMNNQLTARDLRIIKYALHDYVIGLNDILVHCDKDTVSYNECQAAIKEAKEVQGLFTGK